MAEELLPERFDSLLKRYQDLLDRLDVDLPATEIPCPEKPLDPASSAPAVVAEAPAKAQAVAPAPAPAQPTAPSPTANRERPAPLGPGPQAAGPCPPPPKRRARAIRPAWLKIMAAIPVLAAAALWWRWHAQKPAYHAFPLPPKQVRGLVWREGRLYSADAQAQTLLAYDAQGRQLKCGQGLPNPALAALAWADGTFWSTDINSNAIYQHDPGPEHGVGRSYAAPNRKLLALCSDGENIWAGDAAAAVVYRYMIGHSLVGTSLTPLNQYALSGAAPAGLYAAEGLLWVLDSQSLRLSRYRYDLSELAAVDAVDLSPWLARQQIVGLTADPSYLWVLTTSPAVLHRFALSQLRWESVKPK